MRMVMSGIILDACQLEDAPRRVFEQYGADVSRVIAAAPQPQELSTQNLRTTTHPLLLSSAAKAISGQTDAVLKTAQASSAIIASRPYQQLMALERYFIKKSGHSGYPARLTHFVQVLSAYQQLASSVDVEGLLAQAEVFRHHSLLKADKYYNAVKELLTENSATIADAVAAFLTHLLELKEQQESSPQQDFAAALLKALELLPQNESATRLAM